MPSPATIRRLVSVLALLIGFSLNAQDRAAPSGLVLTVQDAISPATSDYITRGIDRAEAEGAALVILQLDTPGGLDTAMRDIIRRILASSVPVAIYVAPSGARAASAGTYMLYAAHIAAMAPGTNLGAATPVQIGGLPDITPPQRPEPGKIGDKDKDEDAADDQAEKTPVAAPATGDAMTKKMVNDAAAYIRSLAELRGRNADWAELAVREAASLSAEQALAEGVIDIIAENLSDLIQQLDGRTLVMAGHERTLETTGLLLQYVEPDWRTELLAVISNPNVAYILLLIGIYGLFFELANPGFMVPGVIGTICLLLALYSMQVLPVSYAGLGLLLLGVAFMIAELFVPSFGALGIGGIVAFVVGSVILFDTDSPSYQVSFSVIAAVALLTVAFFFIAVRAVVKAHKRPVVAGREELIGSLGEALEDFTDLGPVRVHSETWQARANRPVRRGDQVRVVAMHGLVLEVENPQERSE
jgi:membrane-bound serine protease (ClpP class)